MLWMQPRRMLLIRRPLQKVRQQRQQQQQAAVEVKQQRQQQQVVEGNYNFLPLKKKPSTMQPRRMSADLKTQLEKAKESLAKNVEPPLPISVQGALKQNIADLEAKLTTAQKKVNDLAKGATKTPAGGKGTGTAGKLKQEDHHNQRRISTTIIIERSNS